MRILLVLMATLALLGGAAYWSFRANEPPSFPGQAIEKMPLPPAQPPATNTIRVSITPEVETYRNAEWGFEFQYPRDWKVVENPYGSPFSRFNLIIVPIEGKYLPDPMLINIVVPQFTDNAFRDLQGTDVTVANISGKKYEYQDEGLFEISIVLPFKENKIILGANKRYEEIFNRFLVSFKLLE